VVSRRNQFSTRIGEIYKRNGNDGLIILWFTEIARVRGNLFHLSGNKVEPLDLPEPVGPVLTLSEKVYVPVKEHPDVCFNQLNRSTWYLPQALISQMYTLLDNNYFSSTLLAEFWDPEEWQLSSWNKRLDAKLWSGGKGRCGTKRRSALKTNIWNCYFYSFLHPWN